MIIYNKDKEPVEIDDTQLEQWLSIGYTTSNVEEAKSDEFIPVILVKDGEEQQVDTQKAYNKAIKQGWVVKENEN